MNWAIVVVHINSFSNFHKSQQKKKVIFKLMLDETPLRKSLSKIWRTKCFWTTKKIVAIKDGTFIIFLISYVSSIASASAIVHFRSITSLNNRDRSINLLTVQKLGQSILHSLLNGIITPPNSVLRTYVNRRQFFLSNHSRTNSLRFSNILILGQFHEFLHDKFDL